ncbi:MAG: hypothetical protein JOZ96_21170 [Acidobacteria bacterium]|nr:hypothetical protein [Acidobacteriota bacterium]
MKRVGWSLLGGLFIQFILHGLAEFFNSTLLRDILFLPGWVLVYAGRSSEPTWGAFIVVLINVVIYAPVVYFLLYRRFESEKVVGIRGE